jgi:hypothetical protein
VQVHYDEGVAIRIGPKPCAGIREGIGEASAGERAGQPLSREAGAVCGKSARTDLCGGRSAMSVPTANLGPETRCAIGDRR